MRFTIKDRVWISFFLAVSLSLASAWAGSTAEKKFSYEKQLGVADTDQEGRACLTIENADVPDGALVHIVALREPQAHFIARVLKKAEKSCSRNPETGPNDAFYFLRLPQGSSLESSIGVGIVGFEGQFSLSEGNVRADLNGDGQPNSFRSCASSEGLHLTVWDGMPLKSPRRWHRYYYLGYDVEPDCTEKDYKD